jgi:glycosyltransferase involved in cell wall biosynthesis
MKLAIVDNLNNKGGLARVVRKLIPEIAQLDKNISITYFGSKEGIKREQLDIELGCYSNIKIEYLNSLIFKYDYTEKRISKKILPLIQKKILSKFNFLPYILNGNLDKELKEKTKNFDLVYFPWPFLVNFPNISKPIVATFHDFNFKYYFSGTSTYSINQLKLLNKQIINWMNNSHIIVSNNFTASELLKFYPNKKNDINVIPLASYSNDFELEKSEALLTINKYKIPENYIFCGTNTCSHKNLNPLFAAIYFLNKRGLKINLVLTGSGTEIINGKSSEYGVELNDQNQNIFGLGYINNNDLEKIIKSSSAVVTPEMYTSDNGPATDAWILGVPLIAADIPSNREHILTQGVKAELFNYRDPHDLADKIELVINNIEKYKSQAFESKKEISKFTWQDVSKEYVSIFKKIIKSK